MIPFLNCLFILPDLFINHHIQFIFSRNKHLIHQHISWFALLNQECQALDLIYSLIPRILPSLEVQHRRHLFLSVSIEVVDLSRSQLIFWLSPLFFSVLLLTLISVFSVRLLFLVNSSFALALWLKMSIYFEEKDF